MININLITLALVLGPSNAGNSSWGQPGTMLLRATPVDYADGVCAPAGQDRPSPRHISNEVVAQSHPIYNDKGVSDYLWIWGQFIDHDITLTNHGYESFSIPVPPCDPIFDPGCTGTAVLPFVRSAAVHQGGVCQQVNAISAFIDASHVYGTGKERIQALRTNDGTGKLKTEDNLMPYNWGGLPNVPDASPDYFVAGDIRANEQIGLIAIHTLFVREHNRLAEELAQKHPQWGGDKLYFAARSLVRGMIQNITYNEFLPALLGPDAMPPYHGYKPKTNPGASNVFATAAFRLGHTIVSDTIALGDGSSEVSLRDAYFNPELFVEIGMDPILSGLASRRCQKFDTKVVDSLRNFLFAPPGTDLAALNIQRGRDHGLSSYNDARRSYGLTPKTSFDDITSDEDLAEKLEELYGDVENVDVWVGGLAEDHVEGSMLGELVHTVVAEQFHRIREGDKHFFKPKKWMREQTLAKVIRRNSSADVPDDVFFVKEKP